MDQVLEAPVKGFKKVAYATGKLLPDEVYSVGGRTYAVPAAAEWAEAIIEVAALHPVFDHAGARCPECERRDEECESRNGLRAERLLVVAGWDEKGNSLPAEAAIASQHGVPRARYPIGSIAVASAPPTDVGHPHGPGLHFFRTKEEAAEYGRTVPPSRRRPLNPHAVLTTRRLVLREMNEGDSAAVFEMNSNPRVLQYIGEPVLRSQKEAGDLLRDQIFRQYREHGVGRWAVCLQQTGVFIGWCGFKFDGGQFDLGYRFIEDHWGQGFGFEAARAVVDWGMRQLVGHRIVARVHPENLASVRIVEKLGFRLKKSAEDGSARTLSYVLD